MKGVLQKVFKNPKTSTYENDPPIRAELYSVEPLEEFAAGLAAEQKDRTRIDAPEAREMFQAPVAVG